MGRMPGREGRGLRHGSQAEDTAGAKTQRGGEALKAAEPPALTPDSHIRLSPELAEHLLGVTSSKTHAPTCISPLPNTPLRLFSVLYTSAPLCTPKSKSHVALWFAKETCSLSEMCLKPRDSKSAPSTVQPKFQGF